jgi:hypothetical protein
MIMNNDVEIVWKEAVVPDIRCYPEIHLDSWIIERCFQ